VIAALASGAHGATQGPVRPGVPACAWLAAGVWGGSACASLAMWRWAEHPALWVAMAALCALVAIVTITSRGRGGVWPAVGVAVVVGALTAALHGRWMLAQGIAAEASVPGRWEGVVVADARRFTTGTAVVVALRGPGPGGRFSLGWPEGVAAPAFGRRIAFWARLKALAPTPAGEKAFLRGDAGSGRPWKTADLGWEPGPLGVAGALRDRALRELASSGGAGAPTVAAVAFGLRNTAEEEAYRVVGGAHLAIAGGIHAAVQIGRAHV
jgi:hypothetical protein